MSCKLLRRLTWILLGRRGEEDAQTSLEVGSFAGCVGEAEINAVSEHEGAGPGVQHVLRRGVDDARHQLHVDLVEGGGTVAPGLACRELEGSQH